MSRQNAKVIGEKNYKFYFEGGIKSYIKSLNRNKTVKHETIFYVDKEIDNCNEWKSPCNIMTNLMKPSWLLPIIFITPKAARMLSVSALL